MKIYNDSKQLILELGKGWNLDNIPYNFKVNSARKFLRNRGFLHYGSQLIPEKIKSETWSLAWAYIREIDDIIDDPSISISQQLNILSKEIEVIEASLNNNYKIKLKQPLRYIWLNQFLENEEKYYKGSLMPIIKELYESALIDAKRRNKLLNNNEIKNLLHKKAVCFFKLYFAISNFNLEKYFDELAELLGLALGMLDDALDIIFDWKSGYINVSKDDFNKLGIEYDPKDKKIIDKLIEKGYYRIKSIEIMKFLLKARSIAWKLKNPLLKKLILRLTEVFSAPIIEGRFLPGEKYFFKYENLLLKILPENEEVAYNIGHKIINLALSIPQVSPRLFWSWCKANLNILSK